MSPLSSIILIVLMGWQFMAAEAIAAPIIVAILAVLFRLFLRAQLLQAAKAVLARWPRPRGHAGRGFSPLARQRRCVSRKFEKRNRTRAECGPWRGSVRASLHSVASEARTSVVKPW